MIEESFQKYLEDAISDISMIDVINIRRCIASEDKVDFEEIVHKKWPLSNWSKRWGDALILMSQVIEIE